MQTGAWLAEGFRSHRPSEWCLVQSPPICLMTLFDLSSVARQCFPGSTPTRRHPPRRSERALSTVLRTRQRCRLRGEYGCKNADLGMPRPVSHANSRACCCPLRHNGSGARHCPTGCFGLAADRHKRITLAHECFSSFAAVTIGVPAHLASRSLASNSTVLTDPSGPSSQWATCIKPDASPPRPMDHWPAGGRRDFQTPSGAVPGIDIH